jgi:hypothetical protein
VTKAHDETGWAYGVIYDQLHNCGCGHHKERLALVRQVLRDCPLHDDERWRAYDTPAAEWLLCVMSDADLIEHGGTVSGSWITDKGKRLLTVFENPAAWESLTDDGPVGYCECTECGYVK